MANVKCIVEYGHSRINRSARAFTRRSIDCVQSYRFSGMNSVPACSIRNTCNFARACVWPDSSIGRPRRCACADKLTSYSVRWLQPAICVPSVCWGSRRTQIVRVRCAGPPNELATARRNIAACRRLVPVVCELTTVRR